MRETEAILLISDDPVALTDVPALAQAHGWAMDRRDHPDHTEFLLRKVDFIYHVK